MRQNPKEVFAFCAAASDHSTPVELWGKWDIIAGNECLLSIFSSSFGRAPILRRYCWAQTYEEMKRYLYDQMFGSLQARNVAGVNAVTYTRLRSPSPAAQQQNIAMGFTQFMEKKACKQKPPLKAELMKLRWDSK